jgi:hypothetical protein
MPGSLISKELNFLMRLTPSSCAHLNNFWEWSLIIFYFFALILKGISLFCVKVWVDVNLMFSAILSVHINLQSRFYVEPLNRLIKWLVVHLIITVACCCTRNISPTIWFATLCQSRHIQAGQLLAPKFQNRRGYVKESKSDKPTCLA